MSDTKRKIGRPTDYTKDMADKICEKISGGLSLRAICAEPGMPARGTVYCWLIENADFQDQYARAREEQADSFADEIIDIADSVAPETGEVAKAKLQIDARKWKASKMAPKKYGDKVEQQITGNLAIQADVKLSDLFLRISYIQNSDR